MAFGRQARPILPDRLIARIEVVKDRSLFDAESREKDDCKRVAYGLVPVVQPGQGESSNAGSERDAEGIGHVDAVVLA